MKISSRLEAIAESTTLAITARAAELRAAGRDVISLAAGEPDFGPPPAIAEAAAAAIGDGLSRYTPAPGWPELRRRVAETCARDYGLAYEPAQVCITAGTKPAIWLSLTALLEPGDEVIVLAPYWVSYPALVRLAGGVPHLVASTEATGFLPAPDELEAALRAPRVRGIVLNSPNNPSGAIWPAERIEELVRLCAAYDRWIISDEIYTQISYGDGGPRSPASFPGGRERTIVLNGLSKSHAIPGWRLGWLAGPQPVVEAVARVQSQAMGNASSISQAAAITALGPELDNDVSTMVAEFARRREFFVPALQQLPGFTLHAPAGAFYAFPGVQSVLEAKSCDDVALARTMLEDIDLATVPGSAFGCPGHIRFSFAAGFDALEIAIERLRGWLQH